MEDKAFACQLAAWIDPYVLMNCARRYEMDHEHALAPETLAIGSGQLNSGEEGNYAELAMKFLRGFRIPPALIDLMRCLPRKGAALEGGWLWLQDLSISAIVQACSRGNVPEGLPPETILLIKERDAVLDLVRAPVVALLDLVGMLAAQWREAGKVRAPIFHEPNMPSEFYAFVDSQVASAFVGLATQKDFKAVRGPKLRYRAVTVFGCTDPTDPVWEITQDAARTAAASTWQPIGGAE
jgi:hypothetical protein